MASRELRVEIIGDSKSLQRALGSATDHSSKFGSALKAMGKAAALGIGAVAVGFGVVLKKGFDELAEGQKVMAQTTAALKSTGGAANVTAKDVEALATAQSKLTGIDDEAVQAGENMLLTFTNIRNEVGKGNDIFNQATVAIGDMATRMNNGAIPSGEMLSQTAIRVGKALNDPIKGMTALSRVGVQFDADQTKMIKSMVAAGDTMGAQKLILAELTKEFGGSAKAAGETLPGQLSKLRNSFDEVAGKVAAKFLPMLTAIIETINDNFPMIEKVMTAVTDALISGASTAADFVQRHFDTIKAVVVGTFSAAKGAIQGFVGFIKTDLGQQLAASAVGILAVGKAIATLAPVAKVAAGAFNLMGKSLGSMLLVAGPVIALGALVGELAGNFIQSKIAAAQLAEAMDRAAGSARGLKDSLDALKDADLSVKEARLSQEQATNRVTQAESAYAAEVRRSGAASEESKALHLALKEAKLAEERADLSLTEAIKRQKDAHNDRNATLREGQTELNKLTAEAVKANGTFAQTATMRTYAASVKEIGKEATETALKTARMGDEAGAKAAAKVAILAKAAAELTLELGRVPSRKEIIARAEMQGKDKLLGDIEAILARAKSAASTMGAAGYILGSNFGQSLSDGIRSKIGAVFAAGAAIAAAAESAARVQAKAKSPSQTWMELGRDLISGLIIGIDSKNKDVRAKLKALMSDATIVAEIGAASRALGAGAVRELIAGAVGMSPSFTAQFRKTLSDAVTSAMEAAKAKIEEGKAGLAQAFGDMASAALAAFDKVTAAWVSPSRKLLDAMRLKDQVQAVKDAVTDAQNELNRLLAESAGASAARQALGTTAPPGMDPEEWQKQVDAAEAVIKNNGPAILAAQQSLDAALRAQQEFNLEQQAAQEEAAHAAARERQRDHLEQQLANLARWAENNANKHRQLLERIKDLWAKYGIDAQKWGRVLGEKIAKGLDESADAVAEAAARLGQIIKDNTKSGSPTKAGPLSTFDMRDAGADLVKLYAKGMKSALPMVNSVLGDMSSSGGGSAPARGGGDVVLNFYGSVMDKQDIINEVHRGIAMKSKQGYGALFSRTPGVVL